MSLGTECSRRLRADLEGLIGSDQPAHPRASRRVARMGRLSVGDARIYADQPLWMWPTPKKDLPKWIPPTFFSFLFWKGFRVLDVNPTKKGSPFFPMATGHLRRQLHVPRYIDKKKQNIISSFCWARVGPGTAQSPLGGVPMCLLC